MSGGNVSANSTMQIQGGVLSGAGTITASVNSSAIISPGASPGLLTITGNYTQGTNGVLNIELADTVPATSFDQLVIGGAATLAGTLNVTFLNSFLPATNSSFTFLTSGSRSGSFGTFLYPSNNVGLQLTYSGTSATIQEATVPFAPTVYWVGGSGNWNTESNWSTGTNGLYGQVGFVGTQTLGGSGTVIFGNQGACNALRVDTGGTTLTIGSGLTVRGHSGQIGQSTSCIGSAANVSVVNQGTISADVSGGTINIRAQSFTNQGNVDAQLGTISLSGAYSLAGGTLSLGITSLTDYGHINFINPLTMQGTLEAQFNGFYRPTSGSSFTLLTYPSRTGTFDAFDLPTDLQWQTTNGATTFAITATALLELPSIAVGPQTQSLVVGSNATLNVAALGTQPLAYQWRLNGTNLTDDARIAGSQSNSLSIANVRFSDAGGYRVVVTNAYGAITSSVATLTPLCIVSASNNPSAAGTIVGTGLFAAGTTNVLTPPWILRATVHPP